ncbi:5-amino-6-(5-phospho-D-ribitylamino)uracil phosphatase YitU [Spirosoma harenae]
MDAKKLFAFDLDGTLLRRDKSISDKSIKLINQLANQDHLICIATARPPRDVARLLPESLLRHYVVCYNGAEVYKDGDKIFEQHIPSDLAYRLIHELSQHHPDVFIGIESRDTFHVNRSPAHLFGETPHQLASFRDRQHSIFQDGITKIIHEGLSNPSDAFSLELFQDVCAITHTDNGSIVQIMALGVSKWAALQHIAELESVAIHNTVAFGDDHNDLAMLTSCGMGVAMANATQAVQDVAQYTTLSNDEDGVAVFLEANCL